MTEPSRQDAQTCPACGRSFTCGAQAGWSRCWCDELPSLPRAPEAGKGCYCADCLGEMLAAEALRRT